MISCPDCSTVCDNRAKYCSKCGYQFASDPAANVPSPVRGPSLKTVVAGFLGVVAALWVGSIFYYQSLTPEEKQARAARAQAEREAQETTLDRRSEAMVECENAVSARLKAPSSASFSHVWDTKITGAGNGPYSVNGWVDAQNSFGAKLRTHYACSAERRTGRWLILTLSILPN